jgi:hypothetical protein
MAMDVESEILDLKRRVGELEGGFGFLTQQEGVHRDLLGFQQQTNRRFDAIDDRFDSIDGRLDRIDGRLDRTDGRLGQLEAQVCQLREELPTVVGDVMREVLREQKQ